MSKAVYSLWHREIVRFLRDRSRLTGSLMQPIIFWLLFSGALSTSVKFGGMESYSEYFFSGTLSMITLFTAIFATITVIEDRKEGFLQGVLVSPVPRAAIALGKILGGATLGLGLAVIFLALAPFAGIELGLDNALMGLGVLALLAVAVTGLGFVLAWLMDSAAGYHGIMMLFLMPMLLLSGAFFPIEQAHWLISWIRHINPMTYGLGALRHALHGAAPGCPSFMVCMVGTVVFAVVTFLLGTYVVTRRSARDAA
ncbi:MAG: ABC transporter permease [Planctomycetota bacterium]|nr:ABC transporter permease [Planctomycetota bacterium]MEC8652624.1 ABC transporter permease [Planctomycetota bacterium]MEC9048239.1 ABC transporter permease [Planctomycetota bacterium]